MSSVTDARAGDICLHIAPLIGQCSIAVGAVEEDPEEDSQEAKVEEDEAVPSQLTASLVASGPGAPAPPPQVQDAAPVPAPSGPGN